jgi:Amt family ammonium transporter
MNGLLAGLVAVTGGCAVLNFGSSLIVGAVGGIVLILWGDMLEKVKIDDAVGASSVHLACGVWGIIAIGLFADAGLTGGPAGLLTGGGVDQLITQLIGSASTIAWVAITSGLMFGALRAINRLRVDAAAEADGNFIDNYEHGESVWPDILPLPGDAVNK